MNHLILIRVTSALFAILAVIILAAAARTHGWPLSGATLNQGTDYAALWTAGKLANEGQPLSAYRWEDQKKEFEALAGAPMAEAYYMPFPYPPPFLLVVSVMALAGYGMSHLIWTILTSALCVRVAQRISGVAGHALWSAGAMGVVFNAYVGQTGALSAALMGLGLFQLTARPAIAGVFFGLLSYKPHLGLLVPIALAAAGMWRTFAAAAATTLALAAASIALLGWETWPAFVAQIGNMSAHLHNAPDPWKLQSFYSTFRTLGAGSTVAIVLHGVLAVAVGMMIAWLWRRKDVSLDLKSAALASAALLMSPYLFVYDMSVLMVAQAFLLRGTAEKDLDSVDVLGVIAAGLAILIQPAVQFPAAAAAPVITLALVLRRISLPKAAPHARIAGAAA
jgi:hypothetical protein